MFAGEHRICKPQGDGRNRVGGAGGADVEEGNNGRIRGGPSKDCTHRRYTNSRYGNQLYTVGRMNRCIVGERNVNSRMYDPAPMQRSH